MTPRAAKEARVERAGGKRFKGAHHRSSLIRAGRGHPAQTWDAVGKVCACRCVCVCVRLIDRRERDTKSVFLTLTLKSL